MKGDRTFTILVEDSLSGQRMDSAVSACLPDRSRSLISHLIRCENILLNGSAKKPGYRVRSGDEITGTIPPPEVLECKPEPIPIDVLFEDRHLLVINKQAGLVIHPAPGNPSGTLVNAILHHCPDLTGIGNVIRPGIVHRLDKDTSGALLVAKTTLAHQNLSEQFKSRTIRKKYLGLVHGGPKTDTGIIDLPIGRHPVDRKRMSTCSRRGREALTHWHVRERFAETSLLEIEIKTGRTHQIRVHCATVGYPLVGDPVYGRKNQTLRLSPQIRKSILRQMLHAWEIEFVHPADGEKKSFQAPMPPDMADVLHELSEMGQRG